MQGSCLEANGNEFLYIRVFIEYSLHFGTLSLRQGKLNPALLNQAFWHLNFR